MSDKPNISKRGVEETVRETTATSSSEEEEMACCTSKARIRKATEVDLSLIAVHHSRTV